VLFENGLVMWIQHDADRKRVSVVKHRIPLYISSLSDPPLALAQWCFDNLQIGAGAEKS